MAGPIVAGILLAGGLSRRMGGGDKCMRPLAGRPILAHVVERVRPQVRALALNANGDAARFAAFGLPVVADTVPDFAGPLAGVLAGLDWARACVPGAAFVLSVPTDGPFVPRDLASRLLAAVLAEGADMACAASDGQSHPVIGLWPVRLADALRDAMTREAVRKVDVWTARHRLATVTWDLAATPLGRIDPFFNANRPEDLAEAERLAGAMP